MASLLSDLECGHCARSHPPDRAQGVCQACGGPLLARYDLDQPLPTLGEVVARPAGQFRFEELMPTEAGIKTPTLGEGATPLLPAPRLGMPEILIKDESQNPTGSFKARGMAVAMARAVELGLSRFAVPSNGNAGGSAAAYAALHGVEVEVVVPRATPAALIDEPRAYGATVTVIEGTISDAGRLVAEKEATDGVFNLATLREPFRVEGKKMMGYEILWDLARLPDVIVYPAGGGTGLVGMVKAFDEMETIGWIGTERPRMVAVQMDGCAPIVKAFDEGAESAEPWQNPAETVAYGLRVPAALGNRLMLRGLRQTGGTAIAVSEDEALAGTSKMAELAGIWGTPEGGACVAAIDRLIDTDWIRPDETVVMFNTAAAAKYL